MQKTSFLIAFVLLSVLSTYRVEAKAHVKFNVSIVGPIEQTAQHVNVYVQYLVKVDDDKSFKELNRSGFRVNWTRINNSTVMGDLYVPIKRDELLQFFKSQELQQQFKITDLSTLDKFNVTGDFYYANQGDITGNAIFVLLQKIQKSTSDSNANKPLTVTLDAQKLPKEYLQRFLDFIAYRATDSITFKDGVQHIIVNYTIYGPIQQSGGQKPQAKVLYFIDVEPKNRTILFNNSNITWLDNTTKTLRGELFFDVKPELLQDFLSAPEIGYPVQDKSKLFNFKYLTSHADFRQTFNGTVTGGFGLDILDDQGKLFHKNITVTKDNQQKRVLDDIFLRVSDVLLRESGQSGNKLCMKGSSLMTCQPCVSHKDCGGSDQQSGQFMASAGLNQCVSREQAQC